MSSLITKYQYGGYASALSANDMSRMATKDSSNLESLKKRSGWIIALQLATMAQLQAHHRETMRALGEINDSLIKINDSIKDGFESLENAIYRLESNLLLELSDIKWVLSSIDKKFDKLLNFIEFPRATEADELIIQGAYTYSKGYFDESESCFQRAEKLNPTNFNLKINKGFLYLSLDQPEKAIENFKKAVDFSDIFYNKKNIKEEDIVKSKIYALECLARTYYSVGEYQKAYKEMLEAASLRNSIKFIEKKALYLTQVYNALSGGQESALNEIINLSITDHSLFTQAILDPDLNKIQNQLIEKYDTLIQSKSDEIIKKIYNTKNQLDSIKNEISTKIFNEINDKIKNFDIVLSEGKYYKIKKLSKEIHELSNSMESYQNKVSRYKIIIEEIEQKKKEFKEYKSLADQYNIHSDYEKISYISSCRNQIEKDLNELESELKILKEYVYDKGMDSSLNKDFLANNDTKYCSDCGSKLKVNSKFCSSCGHKINR